MSPIKKVGDWLAHARRGQETEYAPEEFPEAYGDETLTMLLGAIPEAESGEVVWVDLTEPGKVKVRKT